MISHAHRAIFFHIPKAAGSSVELKLDPTSESGRGWQDHRTVREVRPVSWMRHGRYLLDAVALKRDGISRRRLAREMSGLSVLPGRFGHRATATAFAEYYKFAVVRNPWARVHSWYRNVMRDPLHGVPRCSFETFLDQHRDNWALRPQLHWITDFDGSIPLDRIVRFETLADEMEDVFRLLGFSDLSLPHALKSGGGNYREVYSDQAAETIAERYAPEIDLFGYTF